MPEENRDHTEFDEQAALRDLERLQRDIEEYRRRREDATEAFDRFVRSFSDRTVGPPEKAVTRGAAPRGGRTIGLKPDLTSPAGAGLPPILPPPPAFGRESRRPSFEEEPRADDPRDEPGGGEAPAPPPVAAGTWTEGSRTFEIPQDWSEPPPRSGLRQVLVVVAAAAVFSIVAALLLLPLLNRVTPPPRDQSSFPAAPPPAAEAPPAGAPDGDAGGQPGAAASGAPGDAASSPAAPAPAAAPSELVTSRRAWVRITADGRVVLERELEPNARIPLKAEETLVIRTGDAGAVRLTLQGEDVGALGGDGQVVTRSYALK